MTIDKQNTQGDEMIQVYLFLSRNIEKQDGGHPVLKDQGHKVINSVVIQNWTNQEIGIQNTDIVHVSILYILKSYRLG